MTEPDDLYTLRAQYWMGHFQLSLDEAKSIARRPMTVQLKQEREEFVQRALLGLCDYSKVVGGETAALQGLALRAQYEQATTEESKTALVDQMKKLASNDSSPSMQLFAAQMFLAHGLTKDALQCVHLGSTMEHISLALQIYLKLDRLDLAKQQLSLLRQADEDAVLTQLGSVYINLAGGSSSAVDAVHQVSSLSEQYGPSPLLLNLSAASHMISGQYDKAETALAECRQEFPDQLNADTLINIIVCHQHQGKDVGKDVAELKETFPNCAYCQALDRVTGGFERESQKYAVA